MRNLQSLSDKALDAFWEVIVRHFPEATTGDLSPLTTFHLSQAAEASIKEWIDNNVNTQESDDGSSTHCPVRARPALPPDPDGKNDDRAAWAGAALAKFMVLTGTDLEDAVGDLLTDLMHWSDRNNYDFDAALDRARFHYKAETTPDSSP